jgi:hypothetical protein
MEDDVLPDETIDLRLFHIVPVPLEDIGETLRDLEDVKPDHERINVTPDGSVPSTFVYLLLSSFTHLG